MLARFRSGTGAMHSGRFVFSQLIQYLPLHTFRRCVARYGGDRYVKQFSCMDQFLCMAFAQLAGCESLRDIELRLRAHLAKLYHFGIRGRVSRSTLADANERRDWRIYADFAQSLIATARRLYAHEPLGIELDHTAYVLDSSTIELCLSVFPWARAPRVGNAGIKLHTLLEVRSCVPTRVDVTPSNLYDVHALDWLDVEAGAFYIMDRGYLDFERLYRMHQSGAWFLMRAKKNLRVNRRYSHPIDDRSVIGCDQTVVFKHWKTHTRYPIPLRRIRVRDPDTRESIVLLTNHFGLPAQSLGVLYRHRWRIEIFFKWIKQHLRIKAFFGTSPNAVQTQVWIAVTVYVLIAILRKRLRLTAPLSELLHILSATLYERTELECALQQADLQKCDALSANQLILFDD